MQSRKFKTVDEYLSTLSPEVKKMLEDLRKTIRTAAPEAEELISYNMPAFRFFGNLVYYAAHKDHIGFYPGSSAVTGIFKDKLSSYKTSKGTIQFPLEKKIPFALVKDIVKYRAKENLEKANNKKNKL